MGLAIQKSEFEKDLVQVGVDLIQKEKAGVVKWEAVRFYSIRAQRLIDEYEAMIGQGVPEPSLDVDKDIQEMVAGYQLKRLEMQARELLNSSRAKSEELMGMLY